jgi:hypothetical protein
LKNQYLEEAKRELINGHAKGHPFRYFVLATNEMANQGSARLCCENITGLKFGDLYTKELKNKDIQNNSEFSALFYDSKKLLQIRIEGKPN